MLVLTRGGGGREEVSGGGGTVGEVWMEILLMFCLDDWGLAMIGIGIGGWLGSSSPVTGPPPVRPSSYYYCTITI